MRRRKERHWIQDMDNTITRLGDAARERNEQNQELKDALERLSQGCQKQEAALGMRTYISYVGSPAEGASLIYARNAQEAKRLAFRHDPVCSEADYIDIRVRWLRDNRFLKLLDPQKVKDRVAYVEDSPECCHSCEEWGHDVVEGDENPGTYVCQNCEQYPGANLVARLIQ